MPPRNTKRRSSSGRAAQRRSPTTKYNEQPKKKGFKQKPSQRNKPRFLKEATAAPVYLVQTQPGLGPMAWEEIQTTLAQVQLVAEYQIPHKDDILLFSTQSPPEALMQLRTIEDIFVVTTRTFNISSEIAGLKQIHASIARNDMIHNAIHAYKALGGSIAGVTPFRLVIRTKGRQDYPRKSISKAVTPAIQEHWPGRWKEVKENEKFEVWVTLLDSELIIAIRLSDASMRHRLQRIVNRPAALRPAVAAVMVRMTEPTIDDIFMDPMAGTGTLVAERAHAGPYERLIAGDINKTAVQALSKNLQAIGGDINIRRLAAQTLPFEDGEISKIAVNLPFGKQVNHPDELRLLYTEIFKEWARVVKKGGIIVALTSEVTVLNEILAEIKPLRIRRTWSFELLGYPTTIFKLTRE